MAYADILRSDTITADDIADKIDGLIPAIQNGTYTYGGISTGSANVHAITSGQAPSAYADGQIFSFRSGYTNTGATTLNAHALGAVAVQDNNTRAALVGGEIVAGSHYFVQYRSSVFYLMNPTPPQWTSFSTTHTGFSANPTYVMYYLKQGRSVDLQYTLTGTGTSSQTFFTITAPFTARSIVGMRWSAYLHEAVDNGGYLAGGSYATLTTGSSTINIYKAAGVNWTNTGAKGATFAMKYEAAS
jgi:hypothetical protein